MSNAPANQDRIIEFLSQPDSYPAAAAVEKIETHGAMVFLVGERAYKLKKNVAFPYMDYSTLQRRQECCAREIELNRLTAPEIYLHTLPITEQPGGTLGLDGNGTIVDWVVVMQRFDSSKVLDAVAAQGHLTAPMVEAITDQVLAFHPKAAVIQGVDWYQGVVGTIQGNEGQFAGYSAVLPRAETEALTKSSLAIAERHQALLKSRGSSGAVRQCHGDLHLRNICWYEGRPLIFDAIEFNDAFAQIDVLYDVAFLLMDLEAQGFAGYAAQVYSRYAGAMQKADMAALRLIPLYLSMRAAIRAHVNVSIGNAVGGAGAASFYNDAKRYLALAQRYVQPAAPQLLAIGGLSGSGKSSLAKALAPQLTPAPGAVLLRSDVLRKELAGAARTDRLAPEYYSAAFTERTYAALREKAALLLQAGQSVIVDAVAARPEERTALEALAKTASVPFRGIWCEVDNDTAAARIKARLAAADDAADADEGVRRMQETLNTGSITWQRVNTAQQTAETLAAQLVKQPLSTAA